jgi:hypothetical protein
LAEGKLKKKRTLIVALLKSGFSYSDLLEMDEVEFYSYLDILFPNNKSGVHAKTYKIPRPQ